MNKLKMTNEQRSQGNVRKPLLWGAVLLIALALRLVALGAAPLSPTEASTALPSLDASRGDGWPTDTESPLLLMGNALLFLLLGPSDAVARLLPALAGAALVALPWLWRRHVGARGALAAAGLLALSPIALFGARHLDATVIGTLGAALVITALSTAQLRPDLLLAAGLALGLTGGPSFYDTLLPGLAAWVLARHSFEGVPDPAHRDLRRGLLMGVGGALLISTGFGLRWGGWAGPAQGLAAWIRSWWSSVPGGPLNLAHLLLYEPVTVLGAGVALGLGVRKPPRLTVEMGAWAVLGSVLIMLRPGTEPLALLALLPPLALLAGRTVTTLAFKPTWRTHLQVTLTLIFWAFAGLALIQQAGVLVSLLVFLVVMIQALLTAGFTTLVGPKRARRSLLIGIALSLLIIQASFVWRASYGEATAPHEPLVTSLTSRDLTNLQETVETLRLTRRISPEAFEIALVEEDADTTAALRWTLRTWPALRVTPTWPETPPDLIIAPEDATPASSTAETFQGMAFTVALQPHARVPSCSQLVPPVCPGIIEWYLYRTSPIPVQRVRTILWTPPPQDQP